MAACNSRSHKRTPQLAHASSHTKKNSQPAFPSPLLRDKLCAGTRRSLQDSRAIHLQRIPQQAPETRGRGREKRWSARQQKTEDASQDLRSVWRLAQAHLDALWQRYWTKGPLSLFELICKKNGSCCKFVRFDKHHYDSIQATRMHDSFSFAAAINTSIQARTCRVASHRSHAYVLRLVDEIELPPLRH